MAAALRSLIALRAAGWELPASQHTDATAADAAASSEVAAEEAAAAFASQLSLGAPAEGSTPSSTSASPTPGTGASALGRTPLQRKPQAHFQAMPPPELFQLGLLPPDSWELLASPRSDTTAAAAAASEVAVGEAVAAASASQPSLGAPGGSAPSSASTSPIPGAGASVRGPIPLPWKPQVHFQPGLPPPEHFQLGPLPDSWDYFVPDGGVFGPFSLEQLQFWVQQGHLHPDVQVR